MVWELCDIFSRFIAYLRCGRTVEGAQSVAVLTRHDLSERLCRRMVNAFKFEAMTVAIVNQTWRPILPVRTAWPLITRGISGHSARTILHDDNTFSRSQLPGA